MRKKRQSNNYKYLIILAVILVLVIIFNLNTITGSVTQEDCSCINADVNRDKILDVRDLNIIVDCVNNKNNCNLALADINKDKLVNNLDLSLYNECHRKEIPGSCYSTNLSITGNKGIIYVYANNQRIAKKDSSGVYYYHNDNLGSPRAITDDNGKVVARMDYEPFGEEITSSTEKISYNSKELDKDTNLLYYGARYYSSSSGRFITADSVKGSLTDPQSLNLYSYVKNNPMKYVDPTGNQLSFARFDSTKADTPGGAVESVPSGFRHFIPLASRCLVFGSKSLSDNELLGLRKAAYSLASRTALGYFSSSMMQEATYSKDGSYTGGGGGGPNILKMYLNLETNTLPISEYKPTSISDPRETVYYSIKQWSEITSMQTWSKELLQKLSSIKQEEILESKYYYAPGMYEDASSQFKTKINLGSYLQSFGKDKKGVYMSIYDVWDFEVGKGGYFGKATTPFIKSQANLMKEVGTPIHFYDRYYLDENEIRKELKNRGK